MIISREISNITETFKYQYTFIHTNVYLKMKFALTRKDIIALNQEFEDGAVHNEASLDFALSYAKKTENSRLARDRIKKMQRAFLVLEGYRIKHGLPSVPHKELGV